jgi:protein-disulfide isomerase
MMFVIRRGALVACALAALACSSTPGRQRVAPRGPGPYDVPAAAAWVGELERAPAGPLGPIPVTASDPARGSALAPVTIVEFADFQCPFCQRAAETLVALQREYGAEKVRVVWKNYPLPFHADARPAAENAMAIFERAGPDGFWRYHDAIFAAQRPLGRALFEDALASASAGVPEAEVRRAVRSGAASRKVDADAELGQNLGVTGTPAFFINGVLVHGAQPIDRFRAVVNAELEAARKLEAAGTPAARIYAELTAKNFAPPRRQVEDDEPDKTVYRVPIATSPTRGKATALVTVVEFADFECPFCTRAEETLHEVLARNGDKVRVVWKNLPLPFHDHAAPAAELALEGLAQKGEAGFWKVHDLLLQAKGHLGDPDLEAVARAAGLDVARAMGSVKQRAHRAAIAADMDLAEDVDATGTPTFFVNGRKLVGAQPLDVFQAAVDEQLAVAQAAVERGIALGAVYDALQVGAQLAPLDVDTVTARAPTAANPSRGAANAKVVVQLWSDLECPFCQRVEPTVAELEALFSGKLRVVWHNLPLSSHPHALPAAEAAMEAFAQKGAPAFWKMHDLLLANQGGAGQEREALERYATTVGLDLARFRAALDRGVHRAEILADAKVGADAGLVATPGFVINGYRMTGALPLGAFKRVVRRAIAEAK